MRPFPNKVVYIFSFLAIFIFMLIDFSLKGYREFPQLNYDWGKTELIMSYGKCKLMSLSHNTVTLRHKEDLGDLNSNNTLRIKTSKGKLYYFRYEYKIVKDGNILLRGGVWLTQQPKNLKKSTVSVSEIYLPLVQNGNINICFIGFSDNRWGGFRWIRKEIKQKYHDLNFIGPRQDIYGYPYLPIQVNKNQEFFVENLNEFIEVDIYIIFVESLGMFKNREAWNQFVERLSKKGKMIYINTWPEIKGNPKNEEIQNINLFLNEISSSYENLQLLKLNGQNGGSATILENGYYSLDNSGYQLYKKLILEQIESKKD